MKQAVTNRLGRIEELLASQSIKPMTVLEACEYLHCSRAYLYGLTSRGAISHFKPNGKKLYFLKSDLDAWVLRHRVPSNEELASRISAERGSKGG